ncbi:MAG: rRNA pseudouridine synthase [Chloroflexi bacterium]|nr:rRNA pseudouridine synthase [Chloroflexota bacterium]
MPEERLQKVLAAAGVASRRESEAMIAAGRVRVDGRAATIGQKVDPAVARIEVDGWPVGVGAARAYVALHKPAGVTSTTRDRHADTTVLDLVPTALVPDGTRLYPVGRLDQDSEGLLILTNDGEWSEKVLHPRFGVQREYAIGVGRALDAEQLTQLKAGIPLEEGLARLESPLRLATGIETRRLVALLDPEPSDGLTWYRAILGQGWKRQLRRMFGAVGAPIERLVRVRIGPLRVDDLPSGRARLLRAPEIRSLGAGVPGPVRRAPSGPRTVDPGTTRPRKPVAPGRSGPGKSGGRVPKPAAPPAEPGRPQQRRKSPTGAGGPQAHADGGRRGPAPQAHADGGRWAEPRRKPTARRGEDYPPGG